MEYVYLAIISLLIGLIVYLDKENRKERERLQLKLMSTSTKEYITAVHEIEKPEPIEEDIEEEQAKEEDEYLDLDDAPKDKLLTAKDNL